MTPFSSRLVRSIKGFTLVETLVAIAVLTVSIIGPFVAIQNALNASFAARDQLIGSMLAQEAIEYVRGVRDGNYIYNVQNPTIARSWFYGLDGSGGADCRANNCSVDMNTYTHATCPAGVCPVLNRNTTTYRYTTQSGAGYSASPFTRTLRLTSINAREMQVSSTVTWKTAGRTYTITVTEILGAWL
jgi:prepilin-type N-terminal cleavage/methylation domain-containing protein